MPAAILIAHATRSGSTAQAAEAIAAALGEEDFMSDIIPMHLVETLKGRTAVILGAPLYIGRFPDEFHNFFARYQSALAQIRPWFFVLGPTRTEPKDFEAARKQAAKQLNRYSWFQPADLQIFGGKWDVKSMPFPFTLARRLIPAGKVPPSDIRDWAAIRKWAAGIARELKLAVRLEEQAIQIR